MATFHILIEKRVEAIDKIDKLCKFNENLTKKCRLYCVNKKCKFST